MREFNLLINYKNISLRIRFGLGLCLKPIPRERWDFADRNNLPQSTVLGGKVKQREFQDGG
jgi:hypothetical protein